MNIRQYLHSPVYLALALIYVISVAVLCFRAPIFCDLDLSAGIVNDQSQTSPDNANKIEGQNYRIAGRAPLWAIDSSYSLNANLFAAELGELLGIVVVLGVAYRCKSRFRIWLVAISQFINVRRSETCIWLGFAIVLALTLFPPWVQVNTYGGRYPSQRVKLWHARIDHAPIEATRLQSAEIDYSRMLTEIATGECFVLALYLTWARIKPVNDPKN